LLLRFNSPSSKLVEVQFKYFAETGEFRVEKRLGDGNDSFYYRASTANLFRSSKHAQFISHDLGSGLNRVNVVGYRFSCQKLNESLTNANQAFDVSISPETV
jgi:hypothetical protein